MPNMAQAQQIYARPPHAACVAVHLDPASSSPCCVCLPRYKALATHPLDVPRRFDHPAGYISHSMDADPHQWHQ
jgi:hypothetical protein